MLVGLSGLLAGYNGSFEFKSGETYPEDLNYTFMRLFNAAFGVVCVPLAYLTAQELGFRRATVWLVSLMVLFENSYATISRFILLDSMLLCFTFTTTFCWAKFHRLQRASFSLEWFTWLFLTGVSIGCVCSVKWVGLFCTALVGIYTIEDLWNKFGDLKMSEVRPLVFAFPRDLLIASTGNASETLCGTRCGFDSSTGPGLYLLFLCPLLDLGEQRPRRCADELSFPSKPQRNPGRQRQPARDRIRLKGYP